MVGSPTTSGSSVGKEMFGWGVSSPKASGAENAGVSSSVTVYSGREASTGALSGAVLSKVSSGPRSRTSAGSWGAKVPSGSVVSGTGTASTVGASGSKAAWEKACCASSRASASTVPWEAASWVGDTSGSVKSAGAAICSSSWGISRSWRMMSSRLKSCRSFSLSISNPPG